MSGFISAGTASAIAAGAAVAGTGVTVAGKLKGGAAQRQGSDSAAMAASAVAAYQAKVARNNAIIAKQNADAAIEAGVDRASIQSMKGASAGGKLKATQAAGGLDVNSGSNVDVREGQREAAALDSETVLHQGQLAAYGYRTQVANFEAEAQLQDAKSQFAQASVGAGGDYGAGLGAAGSLLSGASAIPWKYLGGLGGDTPASGDVPVNPPLDPGGSRQLNYGE